jgi:DNA-binding NtrC family response regulator
VKPRTAIYYGVMGYAPRRVAKPYGNAVSQYVDEERKLRVLIVDDEPAVRRAVRRLLGKDLLAFLEASDLDEARAALDCHTPPDVVVLDLALRSDSIQEGLDFLRAIRAEAAYTPVVIFTGRADVKIAVEAMQLGAIDVIEKGEESQRVREAIQHALELVIAKRSAKQGSARRVRNAPRGGAEDASEDPDAAPPSSDPSVDDLEVVFSNHQRLMKPLEHYVDEVKRQVVAEAIARSRGNLTDAARVLQMKRGNFHRLAVRLGLHEPSPTKSGKIVAGVAVPLADDSDDSQETDETTPANDDARESER